MAKIIRDPVHDLIRVDCDFALRLINSEPFQRLRRIRQLGLAWFVYPGAEHSRFVHSLGVYHLSQLVIEHLNRNSHGKPPWTDSFPVGREQKIIVGLAALAHDFGHGAFSHLFESIARDELGAKAVKHEKWTLRITDEHPEVRAILDDASKEVKTDVVARIREILTHTHVPHYMGDIISSQLDVDRFDYLLRDSAMTGARYGAFDLEWFLQTLQVAEVSRSGKTIQTLAVEGRRGLSAIEGYLLGRHYMYKHVYYHKTIRAMEAMLRALIKRVVLMVREAKMASPHPVLSAFANKEVPTLKDYLSLNDFLVLSWIQDWASTSTDPIVKDLSYRFQTRKVFGTIVAPKHQPTFRDQSEKLKAWVQDKGLDQHYYCLEDEAEDMAYKDYFYDVERGKESEHQEIYWTDDQGKAMSLSGHPGSVVMEAKSALKFVEIRWHIPKELVENARKALTS